MKQLLKKLQLVKAEIGKISKDSTNPFFKSKYFDINALIEHIEPRLQQHGLVLLQPIKEGCVASEIYDAESGEKITSCLPLPDITDPQKLGSAITYYRRYTLQSLLALQSEDDDGNKASGNTTKPKPQPKKKAPQSLSDDDIARAIEAGKTQLVLSKVNSGEYKVTEAQLKTLNSK